MRRFENCHFNNLYISAHCPDARRKHIDNSIDSAELGGQAINEAVMGELFRDDIEAGYILHFNTLITGKGKEKVLVIEPHSDDGVFSCGGTLLCMAENGAEVSSLCIFSKGGKNEEIRREENSFVWNEIFKSRVEFAELPDAPYRGPGHSGVEGNPYDLGAFLKVRRIIERKLRNEQPDIVLGPLGAGSHVDHVFVNMALKSLHKDNNYFSLWFYEDFPYSNSERYFFIKPLMNLKKEIDITPRYFDITDKSEDKVSLYMAYLSQHNKMRSEVREGLLRYGEAIGLEGIYMGRSLAENCRYERFWCC